MTTLPVRGRILAEASNATLKTRHDVYGDPFADMDLAAKMRALYEDAAAGKYHKAHDEAMSRVFIKIARIASGAFHEDNYVDGAAYLAIAAECQDFHQKQTPENGQTSFELVVPKPGAFTRALEAQVKAAAASTLVIDDPINRNTALPKNYGEEPVKAYAKETPEVGMLFYTQESNVLIWEVTELLADDAHGGKWFKSALFGRPAGSQNPQHYRERMPATAIYEVVAD